MGLFARGVIEEKSLGGGDGRVKRTVHAGNVALLDGIQPMDESIWSILSHKPAAGQQVAWGR